MQLGWRVIARITGLDSVRRLRPHRIVQQVFAEVALLLVGAVDGVAAQRLISGRARHALPDPSKGEVWFH
jgi:hypothetical protein